ncbi:unnamed protein product [Lymnaea stagnalis]|uniref:Amino acid transporter transmembrane domain-containing protein n=1 Tax=Lymnaea stagnalis TaxID=6523 RepID=A0AAV2GZI6_LYMST
MRPRAVIPWHLICWNVNFQLNIDRVSADIIMSTSDENVGDHRREGNSRSDVIHDNSQHTVFAGNTVREYGVEVITTGHNGLVTSLPAEMPRNDVTGHHTHFAVAASNGDGYQTITSPFTSRSKSRHRKYNENFDSAKQFVKSQTFILSTHSTIESEAYTMQMKCGNLQTLMNLIKGTAGTGILSLSLAFKNSGLWVGLALFLLIALVAIHGMHILNRCSEILEKRSNIPIVSYADVVDQCFAYGPKGVQKYSTVSRHVINVFINIMQCGFCCIYIVWVSVNIKEVLDYHWSSSPDVRVYETVMFLLLVPYLMIQSLRTLAVFSAIANLLYLVGLVVIFQYILRDLPDASRRPAFASWSTLPMFFGTSVFAFESICLMTPLRSKMKNQADFDGWTGVMNLGMVIVTAVYTAVGFYGYLKFGEDVESTITLNLPQNQWLYSSVNLMFAIAMFISVGVQFYVPINVIWPAIQTGLVVNKSRLVHTVTHYLVRGGLLALIFTVSVVVPHLDLLMSLIGSLCGSMLSMITPAIVEMITLYEDGRLGPLTIAKDFGIIIFGLLGLATGTYTSLLDIIHTF